MVDSEVETTLREIRERVLAESERAGAKSQPLARAQEAATPADDGAGHSTRADERASESLARLQANLATTERTWSRLPPLMSHRLGFAARLELWMKRQIKRAAHWFTWEQVNFNSAVHHALGDARETLAAHDGKLAQVHSDLVSLQASLRASIEHLRSESEADRARAAEMRAHLQAAESRLDSGIAQLRRSLDAGLEQLRAEQRAHAEGLRRERDERIRAREAEFQNEMRERARNFLEEQRVCFKQLSLETGESAAAHERARRQIEARVEALEKAEKKS